MEQFHIVRKFENDDLIIYKRLFSLTSCCGDRRYFVSYKDNRPDNIQFRSIAQVKRFVKSLTANKTIRPRTNKEAKAINKFVRTKSKTIHSKQI